MTMSLLPLPRFWTAIAGGAGGGLDLRRWQSLVGAEFAAIRPFLVPGDRLEEIERVDSNGSRWFYRVVEVTARERVGICDDTGERVRLAGEETIAWQVDWRRLAAALVAGLGLEPPTHCQGERVGLWRLGQFRRSATHRVPVYLIEAWLPQPIARALHLAVSDADGPAMVIVASGEALAPDLADLARQRQILILSMVHRGGVDGHGRCVLRDDVDALRREFGRVIGDGEVPAETTVFRRSGGVWEFGFAQQIVRLEHQIGFSYLAHLLEKPERAIRMSDLAASVHGVDRAVFAGSTGAVAGTAARGEVMARLRQVTEQMQAAERTGDHDTYDRLEVEQDRLLPYLKAAESLGGRDRVVNDGDKVRRAVGMAIQRAITVLEREIPALGAHLRGAIRGPTSHAPVYAPDPAPAWVLA